MRVLRLFLIPLTSLILPVCRVVAHPIPDIPVRGNFGEDGSCTIQVEVDPRCFDALPEKAPYLLLEQFEKLDAAAKSALVDKARTFAADTLGFFFEPMGRVTPEFAFEFTTIENAPLAKAGDPVVVTGTWRTKAPAGMTGYRVKSMEACTLAVVFLNTLHGKPVERVAVLFPGETSYSLDMTGKNASATSAPPELTAGPDVSGQGWWVKWLLPGLLLTAALGLLRLALQKGWL